MGNAYPAPGNGKPSKPFSGSSPAAPEQDAGHGSKSNAEQPSLLEENARLRALVVKLSELVLRGVVDQQRRPQSLPTLQPAGD
ncbi:hypothetical protein [Bradyrhizobium sp.]|uniref:hypothetical protein n=1 Tax=Bradyrhizobium sp. TaxID=376 RepID=UPI0025C25E68|nr:hypothetical protein [Bradyrhizobium sp.]